MSDETQIVWIVFREETGMSIVEAVFGSESEAKRYVEREAKNSVLTRSIEAWPVDEGGL